MKRLVPTAMLTALALAIVGGLAPAADESGAGEPAPGYRVVGSQYSIGDPTDEEQLLLELMNRARRDPDGEADRILASYENRTIRWNIDYWVRARPGVEFTRAESAAAFRTYEPQPPLSLNALVSAAARGHTELMREYDLQSHVIAAAGEQGIAQRIVATGYGPKYALESVFTRAESMIVAHAVFAVDWDQPVPSGETRPYLGHRDSLMNPEGDRPTTEVGIAVLPDTNPKTAAGPRVLTIDFVEPADQTNKFVTGVCWMDLDGDEFYSLGEGIAGVRIESPATTYFAISSASGGYSLPVPKFAGEITVTAAGEVGSASEAIGAQSEEVTVQGSNVKLDFTIPPDPPRPAAGRYVDSGVTPISASAQTEIPLAVPAFDTDHPLVGAVSAEVSLAHTDVSTLRIALVSPAGTEVVLFDHGAPLANPSFEFDATAATPGNLGDFAGETYAGTWKLRIDEDSDATTNTVTSWAVTVRPQWVRPLAARRGNLALATFKAKDSANAAGDQIQIAAAIDAGGRGLDASAPIHLRLLDGTGAEIQRFDVGALKAARQATVRFRTAMANTSRATLTMTLKKLDLAAPLPSPLTVEIAAGGAVVRETIPLANGAFNGVTTPAAAPFLAIDALSSKVTGSTRTTTVSGRISGVPASVPSLAEVLIGDAQGKLGAGALSVKGTKISASGAGLLRSLAVDTKKGTFSVTLTGVHEALVEGRVTFLLRLGSVFGETEITPKLTGTALKY